MWNQKISSFITIVIHPRELRTVYCSGFNLQSKCLSVISDCICDPIKIIYSYVSRASRNFIFKVLKFFYHWFVNFTSPYLSEYTFLDSLKELLTYC